MQTPLPPYQDPNQFQQPNQFQDQNPPPDPRLEKIKSRWKAFANLYTLVAVVLTIYWEINDSGLAILVREWQGYILRDSYYPALDILLCLFMLLVPLMIALFIVEKVTGVKVINQKFGR